MKNQTQSQIFWNALISLVLLGSFLWSLLSANETPTIVCALLQAFFNIAAFMIMIDLKNKHVYWWAFFTVGGIIFLLITLVGGVSEYLYQNYISKLNDKINKFDLKKFIKFKQLK